MDIIFLFSLDLVVFNLVMDDVKCDIWFLYFFIDDVCFCRYDMKIINFSI